MSLESYSKYEWLFSSHYVFLNFNYKLQLLVNLLKGYVDGSFEIKKNRIHRIQFLRGLQQRHREVGKLSFDAHVIYLLLLLNSIWPTITMAFYWINPQKLQLNEDQ